MPEHALNGVGADGGGETGHGVLQLVRGELAEAGGLERRVETRRRRSRCINTRPRGAVKTRSVGAFPAQAAASASVSDRATGTDRHW